MIPDLTTEHGRAQAYANGDTHTVNAIESALDADDRDLVSEASDVLEDTDTCVLSDGRHELLVEWLSDMDYAYQAQDLQAHNVARKSITDLLDQMQRQQSAVDDLIDLVQKILDGHRAVVDVGQALAKIKEEHREPD